jgi:hypothetical protein
MKIDTPEAIIQQFGKQLWALKAENLYFLKNQLLETDFCESAHLFGQSLHCTFKKDFSKNEMSEFLNQKNVSFTAIEMVEPGIEDCFMQLMTR